MVKEYSLGGTSGFTIIEIVVGIVTIAMLAALMIDGWGAWREDVTKNQLSQSLVSVATAMKDARNFGNDYPTTIPANYNPPADVVLATVQADSGKYCINAYHKKVRSVRRSISSELTQPVEGVCANTTIVDVKNGPIPTP